MPEEYHEARANAQLVLQELTTPGQAAHGSAYCTHRSTYRAATNRANRTGPNPAQSGAAAKQAKI
jgi:hypothetical protein